MPSSWCSTPLDRPESIPKANREVIPSPFLRDPGGRGAAAPGPPIIRWIEAGRDLTLFVAPGHRTETVGLTSATAGTHSLWCAPPRPAGRGRHESRNEDVRVTDGSDQPDPCPLHEPTSRGRIAHGTENH